MSSYGWVRRVVFYVSLNLCHVARQSGFLCLDPVFDVWYVILLSSEFCRCVTG